MTQSDGKFDHGFSEFKWIFIMRSGVRQRNGNWNGKWFEKWWSRSIASFATASPILFIIIIILIKNHLWQRTRFYAAKPVPNRFAYLNFHWIFPVNIIILKLNDPFSACIVIAYEEASDHFHFMRI